MKMVGGAYCLTEGSTTMIAGFILDPEIEGVLFPLHLQNRRIFNTLRGQGIRNRKAYKHLFKIVPINPFTVMQRQISSIGDLDEALYCKQ